jgi:hypothetical protein
MEISPGCVDAAVIRVNAINLPVANIQHPYIFFDTKLAELSGNWQLLKTMWNFVEIRNDGLFERAYLFIEMPQELHPEKWTEAEIVKEIQDRERRSAEVRKVKPRQLVEFSQFDFMNVCFIRFDK